MKAEKFYQICIYMVQFIFGVIICYLFLLSMLGTSVQAYRQYEDGKGGIYMGDYVYFLPDSLIKNIFVLLVAATVFFVLFCALERVKGKVRFSVSIAYPCVCMFVIACVFIVSTQYALFSDSSKMMNAVKELMQGDLHQWERGGYMFRYSNQKGFFLYIYMMVQVFGEKSNVVMQLINAAALALSYYYIGKITSFVWPLRKQGRSVWTVVQMVLFLPMFFYVTFVYGIIIGFLMAILALYHEFCFFEDGKKRHIFLSAFFLSLSIIMKSNNLIVAAAVLLLAMMELFITKRKKETALFGVIVILLCTLGGWLVNITLQSMTGRELPKGLPHLAWVVMGLEEGVVSPGSFNGRSGELSEENGHDYDATNKAAIEEISQRLQKFAHDWRYGLDFFGRKLAAQWNEPSFQSFTLLRGRESAKDIPAWIQNLVEGKGSIILTEIYNMMQTVILFGTLLYLLMYRREQTMEQMGFAVIFIGGFLFHIFWEAKGQYAVHYFLLLIPYMVQGYGTLILKLYGYREKMKKKEKIMKNMPIRRAILIICVIMLIMPVFHHMRQMKTFRYIFMPESSAEMLEQYEKYISGIKSGYNFKDK